MNQERFQELFDKGYRKYLVVSYCDDQQQTFYDAVYAKNRGAADIFVSRLRDYAVVVDVLNVEDISRLSNYLGNLSPDSTLWAMKELVTQERK